MANFKSFTIRLPEPLLDQIDARREINLRSRNSEIHALLNHAIDAITADHQQARAMSAGTTTCDQKQKTEEHT